MITANQAGVKFLSNEHKPRPFCAWQRGHAPHTLPERFLLRRGGRGLHPSLLGLLLHSGEHTATEIVDRLL